MKLTITFELFLAALLVAAIGLVWTIGGGAADGSKAFMYAGLGMAVFIAGYSRLRGGAWFTDNANGH